ncbi:MAG: energy-coupling factor ABC transporter ATP-binding protein [Acidobacteriota bacterium]
MKKIAVQVAGLNFSYPDKTNALENINFSLKEGESLGLIGPNGAGKSTLLLHLNGVLKQDGAVRILGEPIKKQNIKTIRKKVGMVFQDPNDQLFMPTVFDDVAFGPLNLGMERDRIQEKVKTTLKKLGLNGYEEKNPYHLSLGERKKVSLATVLVLEPQILVLDEPTANLDPGSKKSFISTLKNIQKTKIIASHDMDSIFDLCSRIILMNKGKIVAQGKADHILGDKNLLEANNLELPSQLRS